MSFVDYVSNIREALSLAALSGLTVSSTFHEEQRSVSGGFIRGIVKFLDGSELHFREFVDTTLTEPRLMYAYHYQDAMRQLFFRYDNAAHKPALVQPEHKHTPGGVELVSAQALESIIWEIIHMFFP
ncbi:hypothetical protein FJZ31_03620 [Candidatus Poribacteria bacterium]|nr:hypothetical protein [Candidatus Poribacteria bacterium]